ncbi:Uncharacterised protein [uncultured archaeon]|nr:Uncharacterised protein [uncultured archaeon]
MNTYTLVEYYCNPDKGYASNATYTCPYGCANGACSPAPSCAGDKESCSSKPCCSGYYCSDYGYCKPNPPACAAAGQSCANATCCTGHYCDTAYMICR